MRNWADLDLVAEMVANLRREKPLIPSNSIDVVISNCVLNLVSPELKKRLFTEIHRVLKPGGRAVISDIVSDQEVPEHLKADAKLWSGCYSGAMVESEFVDAFAEAGLYGIEILQRGDAPYHVMEGVELRTMTLVAYKGKEGPCWERKQAVVYKGPFKRVEDDDGHVFERGKRVAVCEKTLKILSREPYRAVFAPVEPNVPVPEHAVKPFACSEAMQLRDPSETKARSHEGEGMAPTSVKKNAAACGPGCC